MGHSGSKHTSNRTSDSSKSLQTSPDNLKKNSSTSSAVPTDKSIQVVENLILCWLDAAADKETNKRSLGHFYRVTHLVRTFTDIELCCTFLQSVANVRILFIVSGSFGPQILPRIEHFENIYSIYIFCGNKASHIEWTKPYQKIKGIHTNIKELSESLRYDANQYDKSLTPFSILPAGPIERFDYTNAKFLYLQLFKSFAIDLDYDKKVRLESMQFCQEFYSKNEQQSTIINTFEDNYEIHSPIWWYSRKCFLYYMLRNAFSTLNYQIMYRLAFFINDLHRDIKRNHLQAHSHQYSPVVVYRAAKITFDQYRNLEENMDGLLCIDDFILSTLERSIALKFAQNIRNDVNSMVVLFKIQIDPTKCPIPFICLNNLKYLSDTSGDILLSMNTIYRIELLEKIFDRLYEVTLTPATRKDERITRLADFVLNILPGPSIDYKLSKFLLEVKQYDEAASVLKEILHHTRDSQREERAFLYHELAYACDLKNNLNQSLVFYQQALDLYGKYLPANHPILFSTYINFASLLQKQGDLKEAYEQCQRALKIEQRSALERVLAYNTEALILQQEKRYAEAEPIFRKAIEISEKEASSPETYHNLGNLYCQQRDYSKAIECYAKAIDIEKKVKSNSLATTYFNLATAYEHMNNFQKAIEYAEQSIGKARLIYGSNHQETKENLHYLQYLQSNSA